jgi:hypothetical protein
MAEIMGLRSGMSVQQSYDVMSSKRGQENFRGEGGDAALANAMAKRLGMDNEMGFRQLMEGPLKAELGSAEAFRTAREDPRAFARKSEDVAGKESEERSKAEEVQKNLATTAQKSAAVAQSVANDIIALDKKFGIRDTAVKNFASAVDKFSTVVGYMEKGPLMQRIRGKVEDLEVEAKEGIFGEHEYVSQKQAREHYSTPKPVNWDEETEKGLAKGAVHVGNMAISIISTAPEIEKKIADECAKLGEQLIEHWKNAHF